MSNFNDYDPNLDLEEILREARNAREADADFLRDFTRDDGEPDIDFVKDNREPRPSAQRYAQPDYYAPDAAYPYGGEEPYDAPLPPRGGQIKYDEFREWETQGNQRKNRGIGAPLIVLLVILVIGFLVAAYFLGSTLLRYSKEDKNNTQWQKYVTENTLLPAADTEEEDDGADARATGAPITVDWDMLRGINSDLIGWLYCPNTRINYPVVQTTDEEYYLKRDFEKQPNESGTLFADTRSTAGVQLSNLIIYGHNMKDGSMFGTLTKYTYESYYTENPIFYYLTPNQDYRVELLCAHIVESTVNNFPTHFSSTAEYMSYLNSISTTCFWFHTDIMTTDYQLITLSTCSYTSGYNDPRFLVQGYLIPIE